MPELPEVEHLRRTLAPRLIGQTISRVQVHRRDVVHPAFAGRSAASATSARLRCGLLEHCRIAELRRHGKQLAIISQGGAPVLLVQLGMTGQLVFLPNGQRPARPDHVHVTWSLESDPPGDRLIFRDPRRFGRLTLYESLSALEADNWAALGRDALTIRCGDLRSSLRSTRRAIKVALLDQQLIAGVGNIYADESLFRAGIHPLRPASCLTPKETRKLTEAIRLTLKRAIDAGGTTFRDYVDGNGKRGRNRYSLLAYARAGQPCRVCDSVLQHLVVGQRTTTFCPQCQLPESSTAYPQKAVGQQVWSMVVPKTTRPRSDGPAGPEW